MSERSLKTRLIENGLSHGPERGSVNGVGELDFFEGVPKLRGQDARW